MGDWLAICWCWLLEYDSLGSLGGAWLTIRWLNDRLGTWLLGIRSLLAMRYSCGWLGNRRLLY